MKNSLLLQNSSSDINYCSKMKLWRGYVFTPVCHSVHRHHQADTPCQTPSGQNPLGRHTIPGQTPPETATAADGMYPTGMNSC